MKTLDLIDAIHTLVSRDRLDLALALLRKLLKQSDPDMYRQVVQLSWRYSYARSQEMDGQISPDESMRLRNHLAHGLLGLTESMYRQLPEYLDSNLAETATVLLAAIADMLRPAPEDLRLMGNAPEDKDEPPQASSAVGIILALLSALALLGGMMRAERSVAQEQRNYVVAMAEAYGLDALTDGFGHLSLQKQDLSHWMNNKNLTANQLKADFSALRNTLDIAQRDGHEVLSRRDWFTLSGVHGPPTSQFVSGGHQNQYRSGQNGWRAAEF
jgi:uncharacterized tellurite resistance protein B-like protein